ncbi:MAG: aspartate/glutamate racemase family protein [Erythrobacter sp.]
MNAKPPVISRKIGLIGGLSFPSTITYYDRLNRLVNQRLGSAHSARIVLESLDFQPVADWLATGNGAAVTAELCSAGQRLVDAGADLVAMCCNTVHKHAASVQAALPVPLVNICIATAREAARQGAQTVALLGSTYSMEDSFYRSEFERLGVRVRVPELDDRRFIQRAIETELSVGDISSATRARFVRIARELCDQGAQSVVLACTEIPLVIGARDVPVPVIDTVQVHCAAILSSAFDFTHVAPRSITCAAPI